MMSRQEGSNFARVCSRGVYSQQCCSTQRSILYSLKGLTESHGYALSDAELTKLVTGYADNIGILMNLDEYNQVALHSIPE